MKLNKNQEKLTKKYKFNVATANLNPIISENIELFCENLPSKQRAVFSALLFFLRKYKDVYPSHALLASLSGATRRTVIRTLKMLEHHGFIVTYKPYCNSIIRKAKLYKGSPLLFDEQFKLRVRPYFSTILCLFHCGCSATHSTQ